MKASRGFSRSYSGCSVGNQTAPCTACYCCGPHTINHKISSKTQPNRRHDISSKCCPPKHKIQNKHSISSPCQINPTVSSIHLPPTLYNVFLPVLQFSPVSIIPPLLHTHSSIYHPRCIMFFSQYFSFPLSVSFHHCSILIHSSTTHAV